MADNGHWQLSAIQDVGDIERTSAPFNYSQTFNSQQLSGKLCTVKPVWNGHSKIDKTKILMTHGSLMKVESIAECLLAPLGAFCNTSDLH